MRKTTSTLGQGSGPSARINTAYLLNASRKHYCRANLLGRAVRRSDVSDLWCDRK